MYDWSANSFKIKIQIMQRKSIIVLIKPLSEPIARGNFKKLCDEFNFPYHSLKMLKFPVKYKESVIYKIEFK